MAPQQTTTTAVLRPEMVHLSGRKSTKCSGPSPSVLSSLLSTKVEHRERGFSSGVQEFMTTFTQQECLFSVASLLYRSALQVGFPVLPGGLVCEEFAISEQQGFPMYQ